jgi:hypothetical protein
MRRWTKLLALGVVVVLAIAAVAGVALRPRDPTHFAAGARVELSNYNAADPTGVPSS